MKATGIRVLLRIGCPPRPLAYDQRREHVLPCAVQTTTDIASNVVAVRPMTASGCDAWPVVRQSVEHCRTSQAMSAVIMIGRARAWCVPGRVHP